MWESSAGLKHLLRLLNWSFCTFRFCLVYQQEWVGLKPYTGGTHLASASSCCSGVYCTVYSKDPLMFLIMTLKGFLSSESFHRNWKCVSQIAVTFAVGSEVSLQSSGDFSRMGKPFLMVTVALGENRFLFLFSVEIFALFLFIFFYWPFMIWSIKSWWQATAPIRPAFEH